ncbi:PH domain-containing protein [Nocardioides sp. Iso805N]|uniref:PH domain-containing protein n=1 Tax=Nocardioides sp. Iso805N TaxID=1283287 RepID=UPI00037B9224|nr:PH domain-containing protein [Nocardioides sp. Iso805N]
MSEEWQRLDARTLITHPVASAAQTLLSAAVAIVVIGRNSGLSGAVLIGAFFVIAPGVLRWATTSYRVTATHLEVRRGLLSRSTLTARLDRVRTIDTQASPVHRMLGVARLSIGTGVDESAIELDAVSAEVAEQLRRALLHHPDAPEARPAPGTPGATAATAATGATGGAADVAAVIDDPGPTSREIARLSWSWIRYAPLNLGQLVVALTAAGALLGKLHDEITSQEVTRAWHWFGGEDLPVLLLEGLAVGLVAWVVLSCVFYALRWAGLRITREHGRKGTVLRLVHGALTQQSTTLEEAKIRGVVIRRRTLVGLAGGAELGVLATGLGSEEARLLPPAPGQTVRAVAVEVIGEYAAVHAPITPHGPAARRRCYWRRLRPALALVALGVLATWAADTQAPDGWGDVDISWWWPVALLVVALALALPLAELHYRRLGHALTEGCLVSTSGGVSAVRTALATDGIIGWRIHRSFWDRRLGLAQLVATTAAGPEQVTIANVPFEKAVDVAVAATPAMLADFTA